eukprot:TRINITY_DN780_c0_g1_i1.p2 TRINITY_DN780_c0_g1~~TRINITY_DN780_c0_g1_i1.p2  ORF type:complete len:202 (-),score=68.03 TRINITY_DN780_c0_g1_i1:58-663(-)
MSKEDDGPSAEGNHAGEAAEDDAKFMGRKERRRSSALKMFLGDYLNLANNPTVKKMLVKNSDTNIIFSDVIIKVNKRNKMQERILLLTETSIYNVDPSNFKCKRRILLGELGSISLSQLPDNFFALHIPSEYDYLLVSSKKTEIVTRLSEAYKALKGSDMLINFENSFDYRIDNETVREIHFSRVEGGVSTQIYTKQKPKK